MSTTHTLHPTTAAWLEQDVPVTLSNREWGVVEMALAHLFANQSHPASGSAASIMHAVAAQLPTLPEGE